MEQVIRWGEKEPNLEKQSIGLFYIERGGARGSGLKVRTEVKPVAGFKVAPNPVGKLVLYPYGGKKLRMIDGEIVIIQPCIRNNQAIALAVVLYAEEEDISGAQIISQESVGGQNGFHAPLFIEIAVEKKKGGKVIAPEAFGIGHSKAPLKIFVGLDRINPVEFIDRIPVFEKAAQPFIISIGRQLKPEGQIVEFIE